MEARKAHTGDRALTAAAVEALRAEAARIEAEIRSYPTPIAGCDAQFNHLLDRRAEIGRALAAARAAGSD